MKNFYTKLLLFLLYCFTTLQVTKGTNCCSFVKFALYLLSKLHYILDSDMYVIRSKRAYTNVL
jgi:hypothetical protein